MATTFSTYQQELASGRIFSSERSRVTVVAAPQFVPVQRPPVPTQPAAEILLDNRPFLGTPLCAPGSLGHTARGILRLQGDTVAGEVSGLSGPLPPGTKLFAWLLRDLKVPADLDPRDLALLPHGDGGSGNQPGSVFTLDGLQPASGLGANTVALAVTPGELAVSGSSATLTKALGPETNLTFDPRVLLGLQGISDLTATLPSGLTDQILTDLFLRPATVLPELSIRTHFGQRLLMLVRKAIASLDRNGDGLVTPEEAGGAPEFFLQPAAFTRAAVTVEPAVKPVPLLPTQQACILSGSRA
jgi:hypothetical protein